MLFPQVLSLITREKMDLQLFHSVMFALLQVPKGTVIPWVKDMSLVPPKPTSTMQVFLLKIPIGVFPPSSHSKKSPFPCPLILD